MDGSSLEKLFEILENNKKLKHLNMSSTLTTNKPENLRYFQLSYYFLFLATQVIRFITLKFIDTF